MTKEPKGMAGPVPAGQNGGVFFDNGLKKQSIGTGLPEDTLNALARMGYTMHSAQLVPQDTSQGKGWVSIYKGGVGKMNFKIQCFNINSHSHLLS